MVVRCDASDIDGYDLRPSELSNAPLQMKEDNDNIELQVIFEDTIEENQSRLMHKTALV
tara:strand:- start:24 stop:200 length:177 start_codon:yes stop_codon:yes gene_type:complete